MSGEALTQATTGNRKKPTRRWVELLLLILAWGIGLLGTTRNTVRNATVSFTGT